MESTTNINTAAQIEGLLFYKGEPMTLKEIALLLKISTGDVQEGLTSLEEQLQGRGVQLVFKDDAVMLGTAAGMSTLLESLRKEELSKDLSKAALETLAIILYKDNVSRSEIDYIRGVNSSFILRNLLVRGLIEKDLHPTDSRKFIYKPTFDLLAFMGISRLEDLPEYQSIQQTIANTEVETEQKIS